MFPQMFVWDFLQFGGCFYLMITALMCYGFLTDVMKEDVT